MDTHQRIVNFVLKSNWFLLAAAGCAGFLFASHDFTLGVIGGGLIVTVNFHLLSRTLHKALRPQQVAPLASVLAKYYLRFVVSGAIIFVLIYGEVVNAVGLVIGLSIVVASISMATFLELKKLLFKKTV